MGVIEKIPAYVEKFPGGSIITTTTDWVFNTARANSVWYLVFGLACCAIEMMATGASRYDFDRYGMIYRASPRQSDLIILAGTMTLKMGPRIKMLYDQMAEPKYALSMGGCTIYGGPFYYDTYSILKGGDKIIPIDVFVPGCPPRPEALMEGMLKLQKKIKKDSIKRLAVNMKKENK